jgi:diguanylate cyclase (GGDEF)-like protein/PAS domain S-box-containing protein
MNSLHQDKPSNMNESPEDHKWTGDYMWQLAQAVETMPLGVTVTDLDGKILYANHTEAAIHGYQVEELLGHELRMLMPEESPNPLTGDQIHSWKGLIRESVRLRKDGTIFPVWLTSEVVQNSQGEPCALVTSCEDITERKRAEEALRKSEERYRTVLEAAPDPVAVYNREWEMIYLNPAFSRVFGWTLSESREQDIAFVPTEYLPEIMAIQEKIACGETFSGIETCRVAQDGTRVDVSLSGAGFFDPQGTLQGSVITLQDITERKKTEQEIHFLAYHDVLTGLPNRKSFYQHLGDRLAQSDHHTRGERRVKGSKWAILFLDLDKFKYVNDTLGHDVGDELLKIVATRLQHCVRKTDYTFRLGGDEFTILLDNLTRDTDVAKVAQKIHDELARPYSIHDHELHITVSIGISLYPTDGEDMETLIKYADMAMYAAKEEGQSYRFFTRVMNQKAQERMMVENSLRTALHQQQFALYYQPLVDHGKRVIGTEALLRWQHPERGLLRPAQFLAVAEETRAIIPIGKWVLHTACQQTKKWHEMGYKEMSVAINLSPHQFTEPDLVNTVEWVCGETGLPPEYLQLEVTESDIMKNPEQAIKKMQIIRNIGVRFSIDDFGTGYSSLSYLKWFPIDMLKIDRSFVSNVITNKEDQEIIKTIISMAHTLKIDTLAEGVESEEQYNFLICQGCRMMQGYYFGRPMPGEKVEHVLRMQGKISA